MIIGYHFQLISKQKEVDLGIKNFFEHYGGQRVKIFDVSL